MSRGGSALASRQIRGYSGGGKEVPVPAASGHIPIPSVTTTPEACASNQSERPVRTRVTTDAGCPVVGLCANLPRPAAVTAVVGPAMPHAGGTAGHSQGKPGGTPCPQIGRRGVAGSWERVMCASGVTGGVVAASLRVTPLRMARRHSRRCRAYAVRHARPHPCRGRRGSTWQREQGVGVLLTAVRSTSPIGGLSISTTGDPQDPHARRAALPGGPPIASILVSVLVLVACQKSSHMV
jgi:hypothetical protein